MTMCGLQLMLAYKKFMSLNVYVRKQKVSCYLSVHLGKLRNQIRENKGNTKSKSKNQ